MTAAVFIDGAAGTTGLEIAERLAGREDIELVRLDDAHRKDPIARRQALNDADAVVLCLPDDAAREAVALIDNPRTKIIDASTAHRVADGWTYGFPEIMGASRVADARRISNPGCYSTGFIALIQPLVLAGLIARDRMLTCNAVSGYSGGGKAMIAEFEGGERPTAWRSYALSASHKHVPEMQSHSGLIETPLFAPSVANTYRGMVVEVPLAGAPPRAALCEALAHAYAGHSLISVMPVEQAEQMSLITIERLAGLDRLEIFVFGNDEGRQIRLVAVLDNLGKGAAGAAVQNLNLMLGLDGMTGLRM